MIQGRGAQIKAPPLFSGLAYLGLLLGMVVLGLLAIDGQLARSALLGGVTFIVPQGYLVYRMFQFRGARQARKIVDNFYRGVIGKFVLTSIMVALILVTYRQLDITAYFATFGLMWFANTVLTALLLKQR